jgi:REP element-mobilizing transposase RayT
MASHVFHEIYLHLTWHTKDDYPILIPSLEPLVHSLLTNRCHQTRGVYFHAINGTPTHIHLAINIEPHITVSELIGELKGFSAHEINEQQRMKRLEWQRGFGVVSFGKKQLTWVQDYIARQKEHHATGRLQARLEKVSFDDDGTEFADSPEDKKPAKAG